ncbi:iron complex transport system permease protein [Knoellia remsis]|uniref:Iron complex transport system permease protein n=1 Tax=Knoellia remsis TaxID=407159 RepID=A0A2T0UZL9_9MICO|nr:iron chelate uptake ABC transporter family permease subunit [Knoellia remsis]PRY63379.1 iron complex transport system permease protein [Knoellia remsis]
MTPRRHGSAARLTVGVALLGLLLGSAVLVLGVGSVPVSPGDTVAVVARRLGLIDGPGVTRIADEIVWQMRMPRVVLAVCVGILLSQCGAVLQSLTGNDLADPYLLGISSGAAAGAVAVLVLGWTVPGLSTNLVLSVGAFVGGLVALGLVLALATGRSGTLPPGRTILAGVAIGQVAAAFTSCVVMVFGDRDGARQVLRWTMGSFSGVRAADTLLLGPLTVVAVVGLLGFATRLDAFAFGDVSASSLGVHTERVRWVLLTGCALLTAATVALVGPIGFVGLTVPHVVRLLVGPSHRAVLPLSALAGGLLMLWADTLARTLSPGQELPVGVVTAAVGTPALVILLRRQAVRS